MPKRETALKNATILATYLILAWGFYRFLVKLPEDIEEFFIKPIIWLIPVFYMTWREKAKAKSLGITSENLFPSIYFGIGLGAIFAIEGLLLNFYKYQWSDFSANIGESPLFFALALSLATAVSEEITFRGYIFNRMLHALKNETVANLLSSLLWTLVHVPVSILWWKFDPTQTLGYLILAFLFGVGSSYVFARTKNVFACILLHILWQWPIILFR